MMKPCYSKGSVSGFGTYHLPSAGGVFLILVLFFWALA